MPKRSWFINETELDDYQVQVIERRTDNSFVVKGCAGSGKSILALWKAQQVQKNNLGSYYFIVFTKALRQFMEDGIKSAGLSGDRVKHHYDWKNYMHAPSADYIIVDEAQDFTKEDILEFQNKARKALLLYGDTAQQLYGFRDPNVLSMEQIISLTKYPDEKLVFNHRLPKKIARLAEKVSKIPDELERRCRKEGTELPKILELNSEESQYDTIINIIKSKHYEDVGILFRHNVEVKKAFDYFTRKGMTVEAKYDLNMNEKKMSLDFSSDNPKLMTYHSAKGLQFEAVFIPKCNVEDEDSRNPLYVAITRSYDSLFILFSGALSSFFDSVPESLYETSLDRQITRRL